MTLSRHVALALALAGCGSHGHPQSDADTGPAGLGLRDAACFASGSSSLAPAAPPPADELAQEVLATLAAHAPGGVTPALVAQQTSESGAVHYDFRYFAAGVPVCGHVTRAHLVADRLFLENELSGEAQLAAPVSVAALTWDDPEAVLTLAAKQLGASAMHRVLRRAERCVLLDTRGATPAWELHADIGYLPYHMIGDAKTLRRLSARSHTAIAAAGEARVYASSPLDGATASLPLPDLAAGELLRSPRFSTALDDGSQPASSPTHQFDFDPTDPRFVEVSLFAHAEQMAAWLSGPTHHYQMTCLPLVLHAHTTFNFYGVETVNNAMYTGPDDTPDGHAMIQVGDGDGQELANLGVDFDVVAHELGHHVIYRKLQSRAGESGVIHEGLADYLVFAHTGSACLGPSICPLGSDQCVVAGRCLRSATNTLKLTDADLPTEVHQRSQFLSGMLWDLGLQPGFSQELVATLVIKGIDYLLPESAYSDLVKGLMSADLELFQGVHACAIRAGAVARGIGDELAGVDCKAYVAGR